MIQEKGGTSNYDMIRTKKAMFFFSFFLFSFWFEVESNFLFHNYSQFDHASVVTNHWSNNALKR